MFLFKSGCVGLINSFIIIVFIWDLQITSQRENFIDGETKPNEIKICQISHKDDNSTLQV